MISKEMEKAVHIQWILGEKLDRIADELNIGDKGKKQARIVLKFSACGMAWVVNP